MSEATGQVKAATAKPALSREVVCCQSATSPLAAHSIVRREPLPQDVQIEILFCGVCHSDLHQARNEWKEVMATV